MNRGLLARIKVIITAAPTYLTMAAVVVGILADELSKTVPDGWQDNVVQIGGAIVAVLGAAIAIIRRVTPVLESQRGILPQPLPAPQFVPIDKEG